MIRSTLMRLFLTSILFISSFSLFAVCDNVTSSGTIGSNQTLCGSYNPGNITNITYPTGGTGTLEYQWQRSFDNVTWTDLAGATLESYDPNTISSTTYFRRLERRSSCTVYAGTSNVVTKAVNPLPADSITAGGPLVFCIPGSVVLTANSAAGTTYQWKKNNVNIGGATNQTYTATTSGNYTVVKTITATGCSAASTAVYVSADAPITTTITEPGTNFCGASVIYMNVQHAQGYSYQWYEDSHLLPGMNTFEYPTGHNGNYSCTITNACGSYPSST